MRRHLLWATSALLLVVALLAGCALIRQAPEAQLPDDIPSSWQATVTIEELPIASGLIDLIGEEQLLHQLINEAMQNNPDLQALALRLKAAGYMLAAPRSGMLPRVNAGFSRERGNHELNTSTGEYETQDTHQLSLGVSWELDIWGRLANEYAASKQAVLASGYEYRHARDSLAVRVIQAWIEQASLRRSLAIEKERIAVLQRIETVTIERYKNGIGDLDELSAARGRTEIARADLSARCAALPRAVRKLEILLGRYPEGKLLSEGGLPTVIFPPVPVPAAALLNRPDVRAALARVESARNTSRAAEKAILPELRLSGQVFREAAHLGGLDGATTYWSVLGALFQPIFEGGRIINEAQARRTEAEASLMELHVVVLRALKEAEDALDVERDLAAQCQALKLAVLESEKSSLYYEERYLQGLDSIQNLLIAKEQEMSVRIRLNAAVAERLVNRVDLALALGIGVNCGQETRLGREGA